MYRTFISAGLVAGALSLGMAGGAFSGSLRATDASFSAARTLGGSQDSTSGAKPAETVPAATEGKDVLLFRSGKIVEGKILGETETHVRIKVVIGALSAETEYPKADILKIERAVGGVGAEGTAGAESAKDPKAVAGAAEAPKDTKAVDDGAAKVYVMELKGEFGKAISQTPIKQAVADAKANNADYLIVVMNNDWSLNIIQEKPDDFAQFDELFRAEDMDPIFTRDIPREWEKQPKVVFWVKRAMGGAAFLPLVCKDIYFSSEGKMGGIGNLSTMFGGTGDEVVRQKQYSLRMGHAEGMAAIGGYDPRIVKAMARVEYILSVKMEGGKPLLLERLPERPDEELLTDNGEGENKDPDTALARGEGNDVLTLNADRASQLGVSKGTVDTLDDLLFELGVPRNYVKVDGKAERIMKSWSEGVEEAIRTIRRLRREANEIAVAGAEFQERSQARGQRKQRLQEIQQLLRRYGEVFGVDQVAGLISQINYEIEQLNQDQQRDYNEWKRRK